MIIGIGIDVVEVKRIERALRGSTALLHRVFTSSEQAYCSGRKTQYQNYAGRFAAKEAALKALGTGWREGIRWTDVEVLNGDNGQPLLTVHGKASQILEQTGADYTHISISHSQDYAVAVVVLEKSPEDGSPS